MPQAGKASRCKARSLGALSGDGRDMGNAGEAASRATSWLKLSPWPTPSPTIASSSHKTDNSRMGFGRLLVAAPSRIFQAVCTASAHLSHIIKFNFAARAGPRESPPARSSEQTPSPKLRRGFLMSAVTAQLSAKFCCASRLLHEMNSRPQNPNEIYED